MQEQHVLYEIESNGLALNILVSLYTDGLTILLFNSY